MKLMRQLKSKSRSVWIMMKRLRSQHGRLTCGLIVTLAFFAMYTVLENSDARLKEYYRRKNILPIVKLADYDTEDAQNAKGLYPRQILFWTTPNQDQGPDLSAFCLKTKHLQNCPYKCDFTTDRSYFEIADAVVFDCKNLKLKEKSILESIWTGMTDEKDDIPEFRMHRQFWIFHMMDSPAQWINLKPFEGLFNLTMTYRRDSDVYVPFGRLISRSGNAGISQLLPQNITAPPIHDRKLAAWIVSCQPTGSNQFAEELERYIPVDRYGPCGSFNCSPSHNCRDPFSCYQSLGTKYKFYLALEDSLCVDVISESFYNSLRFNMVPVVYGYGDYSKVAPKSSYIDARAFESAKKLADHLLFLDSHLEAYLKYFEWKQFYFVHPMHHFEDGWCTLCEKLWKTPTNASYEQSVSARDLENWWYHSSESPFEPACSAERQ